MAEVYECKKCGKTKEKRYFYKRTRFGGEVYPICMDCLTIFIDNYDPDTFLWILEEFNVPYIKKQWMKIANTEYVKNPSKFDGRSVIGKYLRLMNMTQYKKYVWEDSDRLNKEDEPKKIETKQEFDYEEKLKEQYLNGEISESKYNTLSVMADGPKKNIEEKTQEELLEEYNSQHPEDAIRRNIQHFSEQPVQTIDEAEIRAQLTDDDYQYLLFKWGYLYKPSQLVQMEQLYNKYANEYELNVDREDTLKKICKTSLKMDEALDCGDTQAYQKLASVSDQLRKSGKFTEAQNKEEQVRYLDSIGELVALCEREGGPIKDFVDPDEYPQDKIDFTLKDLKSYSYNLAVNELNLGDLIESYIDKLEKAEQDSDKEIDSGLITSREEEASTELTDEEAMKFQEYLEDEIEKDAAMLLQTIGGDE